VEVARPKKCDIVSRLYPLRRRVNVRKSSSLGVSTIYEKEFLNAKIENMILRNKIKTAEEKKDDSNLSTPDTHLSLNSLIDNDSKMKLFTGLT
jgi:hypothetical protein